MREKTNKNTGRLFVTGLVCLLLLFTIVPRAKSIMELSARKHELERQRATLERLRDEHQKELKELQSPEAIERIAREQLGMVKDGEEVVVEVISE